MSNEFLLSEVKPMKKIYLMSVVLLSGILNVSTAAKLTNPTGLSGLWYDPETNGEGFNVVVTEHQVLIYYFGYANNQQRWLISVPLDTDQLQLGQLSAPIDVLAADGGTFAVPIPPNQLDVLGSLKVRFDSCNEGLFELSTSDGEKRSHVVKLAGVGLSDCMEPQTQCGEQLTTEFVSFDGLINDPARNRELAYRIYYPTNYDGCSPLILVSHGGAGNFIGHTRLTHLGAEFAAHGYVALHINHRPSTAKDGLSALQVHLLDRPADVSLMIDAIDEGRITLPATFSGQLKLDRIGHIGHSFGAYTSHAVAGAITEQGIHIDPRIRAIVPLSPQGEGAFGFFGHQNTDNSWRSIVLPSLVMVGSEEVYSRPTVGFVEDDWRLQPFSNYPNRGDKWQLILAGQEHEDLGSGGSFEVQTFIASNARRFFDAYLRGITTAACEVGTLNSLASTQTSKKVDELGALARCLD